MAGGQKIRSSTILPFLKPVMEIMAVMNIMLSVIVNMQDDKG
jgi:hypothetical protein